MDIFGNKQDSPNKKRKIMASVGVYVDPIGIDEREIIRIWTPVMESSFNLRDSPFCDKMCLYAEYLSRKENKVSIDNNIKPPHPIPSFPLINNSNKEPLGVYQSELPTLLKKKFLEIKKGCKRSEIVGTYYNYYTNKTEHELENGEFVETNLSKINIDTIDGQSREDNSIYKFFDDGFLKFVGRLDLLRENKIKEVLK